MVQLCRTAPGGRAHARVSLHVSSPFLHLGGFYRCSHIAAVQDTAYSMVRHCVVQDISPEPADGVSAERSCKAHSGVSHCLLPTQVDKHAASKAGAWPADTPPVEPDWCHHSITSALGPAQHQASKQAQSTARGMTGAWQGTGRAATACWGLCLQRKAWGERHCPSLCARSLGHSRSKAVASISDGLVPGGTLWNSPNPASVRLVGGTL